MNTRLARPACVVATLLVGSGALFAATRTHPPAAPPQPQPGVVTAAARQQPTAAAARTTAPVLRPEEIRQREQFLNLLIRREDQLIQNRAAALRLETRLNAAQDRVNQLLARGGPKLEPYRRLANALGFRVAQLDLRLNLNYSRLLAGLDREGAVLGRLAQRAPNLPELGPIEGRIARQTQQVVSYGRPAGTPVKLPGRN